MKIPIKDHNDFFDAFGKEEPGITLPKNNSFEQNVKLMAEFHTKNIKLGHGLFIDFKATPEYEQAFINYMTKHLGFFLEKPFFLRKLKTKIKHPKKTRTPYIL